MIDFNISTKHRNVCQNCYLITLDNFRKDYNLMWEILQKKGEHKLLTIVPKTQCERCQARTEGLKEA